MPLVSRGPGEAVPASGGAGRDTPFSPPAIVRHRHLQSLLTQAPWRRRLIRRRAGRLLADTRPELIDCGDGIRLGGYMTEADTAATGTRRLVVLLHGWEGSADSSYVLSAGAALLAAGHSVFRLNLRDHGNTHALNEGLFHSCRIDEVLNAVCRIREIYEPDRFAIVGQSLGGNFALRVAARAAAAGLSPDRVLAICPVLEPASTMRALDLGLWIYRRYFLARWRRSLAAKAAVFPTLYDFGDLRRFATLTATTAYFVEHYTGFESLGQYLDGYAVTGNALATITAPTRIVLAADDPMIPVADLARIARPAALEVTLVDRGGHCGFVDTLGGPSWIDRALAADIGGHFQAADEP